MHPKSARWRRLLCDFGVDDLLRLFVVDEAHVLVENGTAYRPEYAKLHQFFSRHYVHPGRRETLV